MTTKNLQKDLDAAMIALQSARKQTDGRIAEQLETAMDALYEVSFDADEDGE